MSSAITIVGQTRINQLRGAEQPLIIDRMVLALIPGLDPTLAVDRSQQMPDPGDIVHTATIAPGHKGYVDPDQVVYSIILGSDVGDFSFNWIGLVEAETNTVIAITSTPETPKRATNLATNTTGNNITRNFMIAFQDAQNLTGVTVGAETWQFDYQAVLAAHEALVVNPTQEGVIKKHVTDSQAKVWQDHAEDPHAYAPFDGDASQVFKAALGVAGDDVVVKSQVFGVGQTWQDLTGSRALSTTYTNTTGKPICVAVRATINPATNLTLNTLGLVISQSVNPAGTPVTVSVNGVIQNGNTYIVDAVGGALVKWGELR
jgi:hypothetical protein